MEGSVDEEVELVDEANGEGVAEEGEEEDEEKRDVLEGHHEVPMCTKYRVCEGLLHAVRAADDRCQARAEEDGCCRHQSRPHNRVTDRLDCKDVLLVIVLA